LQEELVPRQLLTQRVRFRRIEFHFQSERVWRSN